MITQRQLISLGVALAALLLGIFQKQLGEGVLHIPALWQPYIEGIVGFLLVVAIPSLWPHPSSGSPNDQAPRG